MTSEELKIDESQGSVKLQKILKLKNIIKQCESFIGLVEKEDNSDRGIINALKVVISVLNNQLKSYQQVEEVSQFKLALIKKIDEVENFNGSEEEKSTFVKYLLKQIKAELQK